MSYGPNPLKLQRTLTSRGDTHRYIDEVTRQATRLASKVADSALDSVCTDWRPSDDRPRAQRAWDLVAHAFDLNAIVDDLQTFPLIAGTFAPDLVR